MLAEKLLEKGIEKGTRFFKKSADRVLLKERLKEFLSNQKKLNDNCTMAEEIDFHAYSEYILGDFISDSQRYIIGTSKERRQAYNSIISEAVSRSNAKSHQAEKRVTKMTSSALSIVKTMAQKQQSRDNQILSTVIEDRMVAANEKQTDDIRKMIHNEVQQLGNSSTEHIARLIRQGNMDEALLEERAHKRTIDAGHELFPHYGFDLKQIDGKDVWVSAPRTAEATSIYPPSFRGDCVISIDGTSIPDGINPFDYAYYHQKSLSVTILRSTHYLGDIIDPAQAEAKKFEKQTFEIQPPSLPQNIPCKITQDGETIIEYVKLSVDERFEDGSLRVSNTKDPLAAIIITIQTNAEESYDLNLSRAGDGINNILRFEEVAAAFCRGGLFRIIRLDNGDTLGQGTIKKTVDNSRGFSREERIQFLRDIIFLQEYLGQSINISKEISIHDYHMVKYLVKLLREKSHRTRFRETEFSFVLNDQLRQKILSSRETKKQVIYVGDTLFSFMGNDICIQEIRAFSPVIIENLAKLKDKARVLDNGDSIKVRIKAPENAEAYIIDTIPDPEQIEGKFRKLYMVDINPN